MRCGRKGRARLAPGSIGGPLSGAPGLSGADVRIRGATACRSRPKDLRSIHWVILMNQSVYAWRALSPTSQRRTSLYTALSCFCYASAPP